MIRGSNVMLIFSFVWVTWTVKVIAMLLLYHKFMVYVVYVYHKFLGISRKV